MAPGVPRRTTRVTGRRRRRQRDTESCVRSRHRDERDKRTCHCRQPEKSYALVRGPPPLFVSENNGAGAGPGPGTLMPYTAWTTNLCPNSSFELDLAGWQPISGSTLTRTSQDAVAGRYSMLVQTL